MSSSVLGALSALFSAFLWALSGVAFSWMTRRMDVLPMNMMRCLFSALFFWLALPFVGGTAALAQVSPESWLTLGVSVILLLVVGDSLYFASMKLIGASRAIPIAGTDPLIALLLSIVWLNEKLTAINVFGVLITMIGVYLVIKGKGEDEGEGEPVANSPGMEQTPPNKPRLGIALALLTACCWGVGLVILRVGVGDLSAIVVNSIRQPLAVVLLGGVIAASGRNLDRLWKLSGRLWLVLLAISLVDNFIANTFMIWAFQLVGVGKTATLVSITPIFAVPFSMLILKDRPTKMLILGVILAVIGVALVA